MRLDDVECSEFLLDVEQALRQGYLLVLLLFNMSLTAVLRVAET